MGFGTGGGAQLTLPAQGTFAVVGIGGHVEVTGSMFNFGRGSLIDDDYYTAPDPLMKQMSPWPLLLWWDSQENPPTLAERVTGLIITYPAVIDSFAPPDVLPATLTGDAFIVSQGYPDLRHNEAMVWAFQMQWAKPPLYVKATNV